MLALVLSAKVLDVVEKCMNEASRIDHGQGGKRQIGEGIIALKMLVRKLVTRTCLQGIPEPKV